MFDPAKNEYIIFSNLPTAGGRIAVRDDFGGIVYQADFSGTTYQWNGQTWGEERVPEGKYEYLVYDNTHALYTQGNFQIANVDDAAKSLMHSKHKNTEFSQPIDYAAVAFDIFSVISVSLCEKLTFCRVINVRDISEGFIVRVLGFSHSGEGDCLGEIRLDNGIPMGVVVRDVDGDGMAEIIFSAMIWKEYLQYRILPVKFLHKKREK